MSVFHSLYKRYGYKFLINPFTYLISFGFVVFTALYFYLTQRFFTETGSTDLRMFFAGIPYASILVIPALNSIIAFNKAEYSYSGAKVSAPLAKILALVSVLSVCLLITVFVPVTVSFFGDLQISQVFTGYFVILLYFFALGSLCVFISYAVKNTGVTFLVSALVLAAFNFSHLVSVYFSLPDFLTGFFKQISFAWHFDAAGKGIIDTRDIIFFISIFAFFLGLSVIKIELERGSRSVAVKKGLVLSLVTLCLLLTDSSRVYKRVDVTQGKQFSVSDYSKKVLSEVSAPLKITYYLSSELKDLYPQVRDVRDFLEQYASESSMVSFSLVDASNKEIQENLYSNGIYGQQMDTTGRGTSVSYVYSAIVLNYVERVEVIPYILNTYRLEFDLTSRLEAMVKGTVRVVQVVVGNGLDLDSDYAYVKPWFESMGFTVLHTYLPSQANENYEKYAFTQIHSAPVLILGSCDFTSRDAAELDAYLQDGGRVFISTTPYTVDIAETWDVTPQDDNVVYLLQKYGIYMKETLTADISNFRLTMYSDTTSTGDAASAKTEYVNYPLWPVLQSQAYALNGMTTFWPCGIEIDSEVSAQENATVNPILFTSPVSWQIEPVEGKFYTNPFSIEQSPEDFGSCHQEVVALECTLNDRDGKFFLFSDQYAFTRLMFNYTSSATGDIRNLDFLSDELLVLNGQEEILSLKNRSNTDNSLYKKTGDDLTSSRNPVIFLTFFIPGIILFVLFGFVSFKRRRFNEK